MKYSISLKLLSCVSLGVLLLITGCSTHFTYNPVVTSVSPNVISLPVESGSRTPNKLTITGSQFYGPEWNDPLLTHVWLYDAQTKTGFEIPGKAISDTQIEATIPIDQKLEPAQYQVYVYNGGQMSADKPATYLTMAPSTNAQ